MLLAFLLPTLVKAQESLNTLTIVKLLNQSTHYINEIPRDATKPVEGATYRIWRVSDSVDSTTQEQFNRMLRDLSTRNISDLDNSYPEPVNKNSDATDNKGATTIYDLPDGRYYIREIIIEDDKISDNPNALPFIVDLPLYTNGIPDKHVTVYPKSSEPIKPDEPKPPTGGEKFKKVDNKGKELEGAKFKVVDRVEDDQGSYIKDSAGNFKYENILRDGKEIILTSDVNGRFEIKGLPYGVYWLVETTAPKGYRILPEPLQFDITKTSYDDSIIIEIENVPTERPPDKPPNDIPQTGDIELFLIMASGIAMIILGASISRNKEQH